MKNTVKIMLVAIVSIAIAGIAYYFLYGVSDSSKDVIVPRSLTSMIEERVKKEIKGKDYDEATKGYNSIVDEIQTECFVTLSNGERYVSTEDETKCRRMAFDVYCKIYIDYANNFFSQNSWNENRLLAIKEKAQQLLNSKLADEGTEYDSNLKYCVNVVNDYFAAWNVVRSADNCTSISSVNYIKTTANNYMRSPLTNNSSLNSGLNQAFNNAKYSYARYIIAYCDKVANRYKLHESYNGFIDEYDKANSLITGYTDNYGGKSLFEDSLSKLYRADQEAIKYYKELEEQINQQDTICSY